MTQSNPFAEVPPARTLSPVADPAEGVTIPESDEDAVAASLDTIAVWPHQTMEFMGDELQVRKPTPQALAAFSLATSKYVSNQMRNDMTGMFISRHLSPESYERVFSRLMDPDDTDYTVNSIGEMMRAVIMLDTDAAP